MDGAAAWYGLRVIATETRTVRIGSAEVVAEASLNNCSGLWTATATVARQLVASGAGRTPEGALESAIELAERKLGGIATAG